MDKLLLINEIPVELRLNKRRRTRIAINIDPAGHVVLDAPLGTQEADVKDLVLQHSRWLRHRLNKVVEETAHLGRMGYSSGEVVRYLGESLLLEHHTEPGVVLGDGVLKTPPGEESVVRGYVRSWYRRRANEIFAQVLSGFLHLPWLEGRAPVWLQRYMKSQWGSCSAKGIISLNTHLVRTPIRLIEYVVLHELCHLRHHDHSRRFHSLVSTHMQDWTARSKELRLNVSLLLDE